MRLTKPHALSSLDKQPGHDRLAHARVVGEQEADAGRLDEVIVDRLELVRPAGQYGQWRHREVGVVLVGERQAHGLPARPPDTRSVAIERQCGRRDNEGLQLLFGQVGRVGGPDCTPVAISLTCSPAG